ncbi:MAG: pitrilysin family protein [Betaproteobacteria bacterium]
MSTIAQAMLPIDSWQLANGARVFFVENRALPIVDVSVDFPAGFSRDTKATSGLASMTLNLMRLGAGGLDESEIAERLADVGAKLGSHFDPDRAGYTLRTLSNSTERDQSLALLAKILQAPEFAPAVLEREKSRLIAGLKEARLKPESIAERAFFTAVYRDHPYGLRGSGEIEAVGLLTAEQVRKCYTDHYFSNRAVVAIVGDLSHAEADGIARQLTDALPKTETASPPLPPVLPLEAAVELDIDHPATQSHILIGAPGMKRKDPDYFPLFVGNYILGGGGFASRLVEEVRQKRGLAYSAYSYFAPYAEPGPFQIGLQTRKEQAQQALAVVRDTLRHYVDDGPTDAELVAAKQNLVGGFPLRIDSNKKIHDYLAIIGFYDLSIDYLDRFVPRIEAVTVAQIKDAFRRRVDPDKMVTVVVGGQATSQ